MGPRIGVIDDGDIYTDYLATGNDLDYLSLSGAFSPLRLLDTRNADLRRNIIDTSSATAFDSSNRLQGTNWLDLIISKADQPEYSVQAALLNITVTGTDTKGFLTVYLPGARPNASTLNWATGQTIANSAFTAVGVVSTYYAVRIYVSTTTHIIVDITGENSTAVPGPKAPAQTARARQTNRRNRLAQHSTRLLGNSRHR